MRKSQQILSPVAAHARFCICLAQRKMTTRGERQQSIGWQQEREKREEKKNKCSLWLLGHNEGWWMGLWLWTMSLNTVQSGWKLYRSLFETLASWITRTHSTQFEKAFQIAATDIIFHKCYTTNLTSRSFLMRNCGYIFRPYYPKCNELLQHSAKQFSLLSFIFRFYDQYWILTRDILNSVI